MQKKTNDHAKKILLFSTFIVLFIEMLLLITHLPMVESFVVKYAWLLPILLFKSFIKQFLLLNMFGIINVIWLVFLHGLKLLIMKVLKTIGIRYGVFFTTKRWQKNSQLIRVIVKKAQRKVSQLQRLMKRLNLREFFFVIIAFFPVFILLFLSGIAFRLTREAMVKKGSEIGVTSVAFRGARKNRGIIDWVRQCDTKILEKIEQLTDHR